MDINTVLLLALGVGALWLYEKFASPSGVVPQVQANIQNIQNNVTNAQSTAKQIAKLNQVARFPDWLEIPGTGQTAGDLYAIGYTTDDLRSMIVAYAQQDSSWLTKQAENIAASTFYSGGGSSANQQPYAPPSVGDVSGGANTGFNIGIVD